MAVAEYGYGVRPLEFGELQQVTVEPLEPVEPVEPLCCSGFREKAAIKCFDEIGTKRQ